MVAFRKTRRPPLLTHPRRPAGLAVWRTYRPPDRERGRLPTLRMSLPISPQHPDRERMTDHEHRDAEHRRP